MYSELADQLWHAIDDAERDLRRVSDEVSSESRNGGGWTRRQELGHLIDSCVNNHLRIVTAALRGHYEGPGYEQRAWVDLHAWGELPWNRLVSLWLEHNRALERVVQRIPVENFVAECRIEGHEPMTLDELVRDYMVHMRHHVNHIIQGCLKKVLH